MWIGLKYSLALQINYDLWSSVLRKFPERTYFKLEEIDDSCQQCFNHSQNDWFLFYKNNLTLYNWTHMKEQGIKWNCRLSSISTISQKVPNLKFLLMSNENVRSLNNIYIVFESNWHEIRITNLSDEFGSKWIENGIIIQSKPNRDFIEDSALFKSISPNVHFNKIRYL